MCGRTQRTNSRFQVGWRDQLHAAIMQISKQSLRVLLQAWQPQFKIHCWQGGKIGTWSAAKFWAATNWLSWAGIKTTRENQTIAKPAGCRCRETRRIKNSQQWNVPILYTSPKNRTLSNKNWWFFVKWVWRPTVFNHKLAQSAANHAYYQLASYQRRHDYTALEEWRLYQGNRGLRKDQRLCSIEGCHQQYFRQGTES